MFAAALAPMAFSSLMKTGGDILTKGFSGFLKNLLGGTAGALGAKATDGNPSTQACDDDSSCGESNDGVDNSKNILQSLLDQTMKDMGTPPRMPITTKPAPGF